MASGRRRTFFDVTIDGREVGRVVFELYDELVPKTAENFVKLCTGLVGKSATGGAPMHYKGSTFHRVIKGFMIQGGDFTKGDGTGGESIYGGAFADEDLSGKHDAPFLLSMANKGRDTNGSQFFITTAPAPHLNGVHVVFGRVVSGSDVITEIEHLKVDGKSRPIADVIIIQCGELVRAAKKRRQDSVSSEEGKKRKARKDESSSDSSSDEDEEEAKENQQQVSTIRKEDLPPEPTNPHAFLYRRSKTPEEVRAKRDAERKEKDRASGRSGDRDRDRRRSRSRDRGGRRRSRSRDRGSRRDRRTSRSPWRDVEPAGRRRSSPGDRKSKASEITTSDGKKIKVKGRGALRFRGGFEEEREKTPPHWKREQFRVKKLDELHKERDQRGGGVVRRDKMAPEVTEEESRQQREEEHRKARKEMKFIKATAHEDEKKDEGSDEEENGDDNEEDEEYEGIQLQDGEEKEEEAEHKESDDEEEAPAAAKEPEPEPKTQEELKAERERAEADLLATKRGE
ncbi:hypothetical protein PFISCL1PPCAC_25652, partial [Pristionchus fissidentatus]